MPEGAIPGTVIDWPTFFCAAFQEMSPRLVRILDANGCREGWVQAELYRFARQRCSSFLLPDPKGFWVNSYDYRCDKNFRGKADCSYAPGENPKTEMIAEIKLLGGHYYQKNIDGNSDLDRYLSPGESPWFSQRGGRINPSQSALTNAKPGSLLRDVRRLQSARCVKDHRYMILIFHKRFAAIKNDPHKADKKLYNVLNKLRFSEHETIVLHEHENSFDVRLWRIDTTIEDVSGIPDSSSCERCAKLDQASALAK